MVGRWCGVWLKTCKTILQTISGQTFSLKLSSTSVVPICLSFPQRVLHFYLFIYFIFRFHVCLYFSLCSFNLAWQKDVVGTLIVWRFTECTNIRISVYVGKRMWTWTWAISTYNVWMLSFPFAYLFCWPKW